MSLNDQLEQHFRARAGVWIDGKELAQIAGGYGWRTRCSDLRKRGMVIENRVRRTPHYAVSEYRWVPDPPAVPAEAHDLNQPWGLS